MKKHQKGADSNCANTVLAACEKAVLCKDRMPTKEGYYKTSIGVIYCQIVPDNIGLKPGAYWQFGQTPEWWIEM